MTRASSSQEGVKSSFPATSKQRAGATEAIRWLHQLLPDVVLLLVLASGFLFLFNFWWSIPTTIRPGGPLGNSMDSLTARGVLPPLGLLILLIAFPFAIRRLRWRINHTHLFWKDVCPQCGDEDLQRIPRKPHERRIANLGIPVRRYYCVNCRWRGTRIEGTLVHD